jgi:hypothetical protein
MRIPSPQWARPAKDRSRVWLNSASTPKQDYFFQTFHGASDRSLLVKDIVDFRKPRKSVSPRLHHWFSRSRLNIAPEQFNAGRFHLHIWFLDYAEDARQERRSLSRRSKEVFRYNFNFSPRQAG